MLENNYPVSTHVTVDMVKNLSISSNCLKTFPCQHFCHIELSDGRKVEVNLYNPSIHSLLQTISLEKIAFELSSHHFHSLDDSSPHPKEIAEQTLTNIFNIKNAGQQVEQKEKSNFSRLEKIMLNIRAIFCK